MEYRSDLPERPRRMLSLPIDDRGFPIPWFVHIDNGKADFRVIRPGGINIAHAKELCWLCGERRGAYLTFVVGPMCGINRVTAEPPCHRECAEYAARACPFLTRPLAVRNERDMPEEADVAGFMIKRNPGVSLLWTTKSYKPFRVEGGSGYLLRLGEPTDLKFYAKGRKATLDEIWASVESGYPILEKMAQEDGDDAIKVLVHQRRIFDRLIAHHGTAQDTPSR
jgi:hypothetical protein